MEVMRGLNYFFSATFTNSYPSVDTFFLISGLLVAYNFFNVSTSIFMRAHSNPRFAHNPLTWIKYCVHRWVRLTPAYMFFIALFVAWQPQMHDVWAIGTAENFTHHRENCEAHWWMNALYINNFLGPFENCYPISWFLAVDTQLYLAAPFFLLAIYYSCTFSVFFIVNLETKNNCTKNDFVLPFQFCILMQTLF
ncbi:hypothetical protein PMAYCL1PPCAC_09736 [Pristionchus mayeri]|uniref:Acyltransferase 3 domain-containing protein n=1 Tax=Pristionchus mayeri TaxID=1317129 RepID=A0AAN4ZEY5_9BILA|nr:hypothetical protein PMAYCL1PPCAC_09736 [Pristionchus mayeri]